MIQKASVPLPVHRYAVYRANTLGAAVAIYEHKDGYLDIIPVSSISNHYVKKIVQPNNIIEPFVVN